MNLAVGVVGCGLMGERRARSALAAGEKLVLVADIDPGRARAAASALGTEWTSDWREVTGHPGIDAVVVATYNKALLPVASAALGDGKHVLSEKPFGRNVTEARTLLEAWRAAERVVKVGFTLRHHAAVKRAWELSARRVVGKVVSIRAVYGHGGRPGYEREWRGDPDLAGGGELLDQGVHLVDLCRWFLGEIATVTGVTATWIWDVAPLEDNGFALLGTEDGRVASIHTSWTQWKNLFRFEVFGTDGYMIVEGLGGTYGVERLTVGRRDVDGGAPTEGTWLFPDADDAWVAEWQDFTAAIRLGRDPVGDARDGYAAAQVIDAIYASARDARTIHLGEIA